MFHHVRTLLPLYDEISGLSHFKRLYSALILFEFDCAYVFLLVKIKVHKKIAVININNT